jgi:CheY-like chemotaxis protein
VDVILMDIVMKRVHGTDAARALRAAADGGPGGTQFGSHVPPIVCVSANTAILDAPAARSSTGTASAVVSPAAAAARRGSGPGDAPAACTGGKGGGGGGGGGGGYDGLFAAVLAKPFTKHALERVVVQVLGLSTPRPARTVASPMSAVGRGGGRTSPTRGAGLVGASDLPGAASAPA